MPTSGYSWLRGAKGDVLEGGARVPAMAWWPGIIEPNQTPTDILDITNLFTTAARLAGATDKIPGDRITDGIDQTSLFLLGEGHGRRNMMFHYSGGTLGAIRYADYRGGIVYAVAGRQEKGRQTELVMRVLPWARQLNEFETLTRIFGLDPNAKQYRMKIGWQPEDTDDIVIETRPLLSAMFFLGRSIEIPEELRARKVAYFNLDQNDQPFDWSMVLGDLLTIHSSSTVPPEAQTAVYYRDYWYFIDDSDIKSKETLSMLYVVFALKAGGSRSPAPVLTIPVE